MTAETETGYKLTSDYMRGGENWKGALELNAQGSGGYAYFDYYLGGKYTKLKFKGVPYDRNFTSNSISTLIISDKDTGEELYVKGDITMEGTNVFSGSADVTGVEYLRIYVSKEGGFSGHVLLKDCYLY